MFISNEGGSPTDVAIDGDLLYWLDATRGRLESIRTDGTGRGRVLTGNTVKSFIAFDIYKVCFVLK